MGIEEVNLDLVTLESFLTRNVMCIRSIILISPRGEFS